MKFYKGTVDGVIDEDNLGVFRVNVLESAVETAVWVNYVSPFYDPHRGGMLAIPYPKSEVLIMYDESLGEYFYMGTIFGKSKFTPGSDSAYKGEVAGSKRAYNMENMPAAVMITNSDGAGLKINNYLGGNYAPTVKSVVVESTQGHRLELSDSPSRDQVALKNKNQEGITITGESNAVKDARCIDIKTLNSIRTRAVKGEVRVDLTHGRDITIKNGSDGQSGGFETSSTRLGKHNPIPAGNLNLVTSYKDINIYTENTPNSISGKAGRVLISTPQGVIQLKSGSDGLTIYSEGNINIASVATSKPIKVESLGINPITSIPNSRGTLKSWKVQETEEVKSGTVMAEIQPAVGNVIPVICPYNGILTKQIVKPGGPVSFRTPIGTILTSGGDINLESSNNINLKSQGSINLNSNSINLDSQGQISARSDANISVMAKDELQLAAGKKVTATGSDGVEVGGKVFTMGATNSNINLVTTEGEAIYIAQPVEAISPSPPTELTQISIIPDRGAYSIGKQP